jgi:hypothetical protein
MAELRRIDERNWAFGGFRRSHLSLIFAAMMRV